jgi:hypothetical protein
MESNRFTSLVSWLRISAAGSLDPHVGQAADAIEAQAKRIVELEEALNDAEGALRHAYIMGFTERYRDAAEAIRKVLGEYK